MKLGFIGAGKVAQAMAKGIISSGLIAADNIIASAPKSKIDNQFLEQIAKNGIKITHSNTEVVRNSDIIILAIKPNIVPKILPEIAPEVTKKNLILSFALGITIRTIEKSLPTHSRVVRVMPNIAMDIQRGTAVYTLGSSVRESDGELVAKLMTAVGYAEELTDETLMDIVTGLSGSGPAYGFMVIESLVDGAVMMGLPRSQATRLAAHTLLGAAQMVLEGNGAGSHGCSLGSLKESVCSPGGCTARSVYVLEKMGLRAALIAAVEASTRRARELSRPWLGGSMSQTQTANDDSHSNPSHNNND